MFDIRERGKDGAKKDRELLPFAEEILVTKSDLEERTAKLQDLKTRVEELQHQMEYSIRLKELNHSDKIRELTDKHTVEQVGAYLPSGPRKRIHARDPPMRSGVHPVSESTFETCERSSWWLRARRRQRRPSTRCLRRTSRTWRPSTKRRSGRWRSAISRSPRPPLRAPATAARLLKKGFVDTTKQHKPVCCALHSTSAREALL